MRKMWRVILSIVLILILIGIVAVAVGFLTGADSARNSSAGTSSTAMAQIVSGMASRM